jgi:hypothetical protein
MHPTLDGTHLIALAAALGWASGLRFYAVVFLAGAAGALGWVVLPGGLHVLQHPAVLVASGFMLVVEFLADKIPAVDSAWDVVQTVVRVPGGALLAAAVFGLDQPTMAVVAGLLGGALAATSHVTKAATRAAVNTSPEPFSNLGLSLFGDALVPAMLWLAAAHPWLFFGALAVALAVMAVLLWLFARFLVAIARRAASWFGVAAAHPGVHARR